MVECMFEFDCANANKPKCQICMRINKQSGCSHFPAFKDKQYYAKTLPIIPNLKRLFEVLEGKKLRGE